MSAGEKKKERKDSTLPTEARVGFISLKIDGFNAILNLCCSMCGAVDDGEGTPEGVTVRGGGGGDYLSISSPSW